MERKFNSRKALKNDYGLLVALLFIVMPVLLEIAFIFVNIIDINSFLTLSIFEIIKTSDFIEMLIFSFIFLFSLFIFIKRVIYIKSFEHEYIKVSALVVDVFYDKDRFGMDVEFQFNGELCKKHFALMRNPQTKFIRPGVEVVLIMKNENPKKVLIEELYFDQE